LFRVNVGKEIVNGFKKYKIKIAAIQEIDGEATIYQILENILYVTIVIMEKKIWYWFPDTQKCKSVHYKI
jgi:hypothetical protein